MRISLTKTKWSQLMKPCVYWVIHVSKGVLYVGVGEHGLSRVFSTCQHEVRQMAFDNCTSIEVEFFDTMQEAANREIAELHLWHPAYQMCSVCSANNKSNPNPARQERTKARYLKTAAFLAQQYGGIPHCTWLLNNGYGSFYRYAQKEPFFLDGYRRVKL